jgi:hypothetical protein
MIAPWSFFPDSRSTAESPTFSVSGIIPRIVAVPPRRRLPTARAAEAGRPTASIA